MGHNSPPDGPQVTLRAVCFSAHDRKHVSQLLSTSEALLIAGSLMKATFLEEFSQAF